MRPSLVKALVALLATSVFSTPAHAIPITWNLSGVAFNDGGTAFGSFVYDATTNQYSAVDLTTTNGSARTGAHYQFVVNSFLPDASGVLFATSNAANLTGTPGLALFFSPPLSNAGGAFPLDFGQEGTCGNATCDFPIPPQRFVVSGGVTTGPTQVPEPASILLLGFGLSMWRVARGRRR